ncbi:MAG: hypothetical protein SFW67_05695 [Myxococcaceae bacterium]|nr:hypothetical protein [Myxococcaceae bacterium]
MAKPIPQLKRPAIPAAVAEGFISAGANAAATPLPPAPQAALSVVPEQGAATSVPAVEVAAEATAAPLAVEPPAPVPAPPAERKAAPRARASTGGRQLTKRVTGEEVRKVTFYLPPELDQELSLHCVRNGLDRKDVVIAALRKVVRGS